MDGNEQIYLLLIRQLSPLAKNNPVMMLKAAILGDSLDVPFLKFIRVNNFEHSIGFAGETSKNVIENGQVKSYSSGEGGMGGYNQSGTVDVRGGTKTTDRWGNREFRAPNQDLKRVAKNTAAPKYTSKFKNNEFVNLKLPEHNDLTFTKPVDNATPQLAYACTAQEPLSEAIFFFRRRIGAGVAGVRLPYFMCRLQKCLITSWGLDDDLNESVTLKYKEILWATYDQLADINAPTGMSSRVWDVEQQEGGESTEVYKFQAMVAALFAAAGAAWGATEGSHGVQAG